jgi:hypothetical protein
MIERRDASAAALDGVAILTREFQARILDYSPSGCLIETNARVDVGTIGSLHFVIDGNEFVDDVQVVRCQPIEGAGSMYRVGARFLWTISPGRGTLRRALGRPSEHVASGGLA